MPPHDDSMLITLARSTLVATRSNEAKGLRMLAPELTLDGVRATDLICWDHITGRGGCSCGGAKAHIFEKACGGAINLALGGLHVCRRSSEACQHVHPPPDEVRAVLGVWWSERNGGREPIWGVAAPVTSNRANNAMHGGDRATATASGEEAAHGGKPCTVPVEVQLERIAKYETSSAHLRRFLREPFLPTITSNEALRGLLTMRKCAKEVSEAYGAAGQVIDLMGRLRAAGAAGCGARGEGLVVLDVCSGKGLTAVLLSFLLPAARVVLFDSNGAMDLAHVAARRTLAFRQLDLFAADACNALRDAAEAEGARVAIAIGTHLCGALSPRLLDLALRVPSIHGLVLSPCCLRGALGAKIGKAGKMRKLDPYVILVDTLAALCREQLRQSDSEDGRPMAAAAAAAVDGEAAAAVTAEATAAATATPVPPPPPPSAPHAAAAGDTTAIADATAPAWPSAACEPCSGGHPSDEAVRVVWDAEVLSPRNAFIVATMPPRVAVGPAGS